MAYSKTFNDSVTSPNTVKINTSVLVSPDTVVWSGNRSGTRVANYKDLIKQGLNAASAFSSDRYQISEMETGSFLVTGKNAGQPGATPIVHAVTGLVGAIPPVIAHLTGGASEANSIALASIHKKINAQITHVNLPAAFLEFGDVIRQFGAPARSILRLTEAHINRLYLQRRGVRALKYNRKQWLKTMADSWLEYSFGLSPLINDTKKTAEALAQLIYERDENPVLRTRLRSRGSAEKGLTSAGQSSVARISFQRGTKTVTDERVQYVCGFKAYPTADPGSLDRLLQLTGFRPESWIPAIWEAVPWSWLVDYFTNVQDILSSVEASVIKPEWIVKTVSTETTITTRFRYDAIETAKSFSAAGLVVTNAVCDPGTKLESRRLTMQRTIPPMLGIPNVYFRLPTGLKQLGNMAAVITTLKRSTPNISLETHYRNFDKPSRK